MRFVRGFGLLTACLPFVALGCGGSSGGAAKTKELIVGKWKAQKDNKVILLEFTADSVIFSSQRDGSGPSGQGTYKVVDDKTLELPKLGVPFDEKVTIDSITADKLVLSGGETWKLSRTEFVKEGSSAPVAASNTDKIVGTWEVVKSATGSDPGDTAAFAKDGKLKMTMTAVGFSVDYTYQVEGDKIKTVVMGKDRGPTFTIRELTATRLVTVDELGKTNEYKKK